MRNYETVDESKRPNPMLGLIGFIILIVVGGISFALSGPIMVWLQTAQVVIGPSAIKVLPIQFPPDWSPLGDQTAVAFGVFLLVFGVIMLVLFSFMRPSFSDPRDVSLDTLRREAAERKRRR
jgi:hypothetical protein